MKSLTRASRQLGTNTPKSQVGTTPESYCTADFRGMESAVCRAVAMLHLFSCELSQRQFDSAKGDGGTLQIGLVELGTQKANELNDAWLTANELSRSLPAVAVLSNELLESGRNISRLDNAVSTTQALLRMMGEMLWKDEKENRDDERFSLGYSELAYDCVTALKSQYLAAEESWNAYVEPAVQRSAA